MRTPTNYCEHRRTKRPDEQTTRDGVTTDELRILIKKHPQNDCAICFDLPKMTPFPYEVVAKILSYHFDLTTKYGYQPFALMMYDMGFVAQNGWDEFTREDFVDPQNFARKPLRQPTIIPYPIPE